MKGGKDFRKSGEPGSGWRVGKCIRTMQVAAHTGVCLWSDNKGIWWQPAHTGVCLWTDNRTSGEKDL